MPKPAILLASIMILAFTPYSGHSEKLICKGPAPGEIYFVGPDVSSDSLTGSFLYHSMDYGSTLVMIYEDPDAWDFWYITADATPGGVYRVSNVHRLYYSNDNGETWDFQSEPASDISSGIRTGIIYRLHSGIHISYDYGVNFTRQGSSPGNEIVIGYDVDEIYILYDIQGKVYFSSDSGESYELKKDFPDHLWNITRGVFPGEVYAYKVLDSIYYSPNYGDTFYSTGYLRGSGWLGNEVDICWGNIQGELYAIRVKYYEIPTIGQSGGEVTICHSTNYGATFDCITHSSRDTRVEEGEVFFKPEEMEIFVYPNPFNSVCKIAFVGALHATTLEIFDINGRLVRGLECSSVGGVEHPGSPGSRITGSPIYTWNPENLPSGIYFIKASNGEKTAVRKVLYLK